MAQKKSWLATHAEYVLAVSLVTLLRFVPANIAHSVARAAAGTLDRAVPKLRRVAHTNLSFAYPEIDERERNQLIDGVFRTIARMLMGLARFPDLSPANVHKLIEYDGLENYLDAKKMGKGVLVATAHFGNWELSAFAHALMTEPMNVMVRPLDNALINRLVEKRRIRSGNRLILKTDGARAVLRALRNNEAVGILVDQNTSVAEGVFMSFFGKPACANTGFVKLAYHSQAPVIPGFAVWNEARGRYVLHFLPRVPMTGDEQADTQRIHAILEKVIRQYPDQWMWIHRRWKTRPPNEESLY